MSVDVDHKIAIQQFLKPSGISIGRGTTTKNNRLKTYILITFALAKEVLFKQYYPRSDSSELERELNYWYGEFGERDSARNLVSATGMKSWNLRALLNFYKTLYEAADESAKGIWSIQPAMEGLGRFLIAADVAFN